MEYSLNQLVNALAKFDGTTATPSALGNPLGIVSIARTVGGAAAGDYSVTLTDGVSEDDSVTFVGAASSSDPTKFCGPPVFVGGYFVTSSTVRRVIMTDANGVPSDGFFAFMVVRTLIG